MLSLVLPPGHWQAYMGFVDTNIHSNISYVLTDENDNAAYMGENGSVEKART